jgi:hypothetical protein
MRTKNTRGKSRITKDWGELIDFSEERLREARLRTTQLEAIVGYFRARAEAGDQCPTELARGLIGSKTRE